MDRVTSRQLRAVRGVVASALTTVLAATAHTLAGAGAPSPGLVAIAAVMAAPLGVLLVGRRRSAARTIAAVVAAQVVFHVTFVLFSAPAAVVYAPMSGHAAMHAAPTMMMASGAAHAMDAPMVATHALAGLVTIALLLHGERLLRALGRGIRHLLPVVCTEPPHPATAPVLRAAFRWVAPLGLRFAAVVSRRGPPVVAF